MGKKYILFAVLLGIVLGLVGFFVLNINKEKKGVISIETTPTSTVFINGRRAGTTPYEGTFSPKEVRVALTADGFANFETKVKVTSGVKTIIRREFGITDALSSNQIISFEKEGTDPTISIVTEPDSVQVAIDGKAKGFTPIKIVKLTEGEHQLVLAAKGYKQMVFKINAIAGYKLTAIVKLAQEMKEGPPVGEGGEEGTISATPNP